MNGADMDRMFNPLFNHIKDNNISMTSPVVMELSQQAPGRTESMAFVYGDPTIGKPGPAEGKVRIEDVPPLVVISIAQRGGYSASNFRKGEETLRNWLAERPGRADHAASEALVIAAADHAGERQQAERHNGRADDAGRGAQKHAD